MAKVEFICQRLDGKDNIDQRIKDCLCLEKLTAAYISVAFARYDGVESLFEILQQIGKKLTIFVGIDNQITSVQALDRLFDTNANLYTVETASSVVFHPKFYSAENTLLAKAICGSSNLTNAGLHSNIEFCTYSTFAKTDQSDAIAYDFVKQVLLNMPSKFPNHVKLISNKKILKGLLSKGLVEDESVHIERKTQKSNKKTSSPTVMLPATTLSFSHRTSAFTEYALETHKTTTSAIISDQFKLLWESKELTERDLNIPRGTNTNPTGSMGMKKGNLEIDQRSYFRQDVFQHLAWKNYTARSGAVQEESTATFKLKIHGEDYGNFTLRITHDPRTNTASYAQNNMMTHLHWGDAKNLIANRDYLGQFMRLYRSENDKTYFLLTID